MAISGVKNSGKTTLIEKLLPLLIEKGLAVAVIKHDGHSFIPDVQGTDSYRYRVAGAYGVAVFDKERHMVIREKPVTPEVLIAQFPEADLILLEGFKFTSYPKIEIVRKENSDQSICAKEHLLAVATDIEGFATNVPKLDLQDRVAIAAFIYRYAKGSIDHAGRL